MLPTIQLMAGLKVSVPAAAAAAEDSGRLGEALGDFRLIREIGRGGMGVVYEAQQLSLRRRVALKVLPFASVLDSRQLQRFQNEAQAAALLHHPRIVPVHGVGCDRGVHYYAMQLIDGPTLAEVIRQQRSRTGLGPAAAIAGLLLTVVTMAVASLLIWNEQRRTATALGVAVSERTKAQQERQQAEEAHQRADEQATIARAINDFLRHDLLEQADVAEKPGGEVLRDPDVKVRTLLDRASRRIA